MIIPPINLWNYTANKDWFDNNQWLRPHSKETKSVIRKFRIVDAAKINEILSKR